MRFIKLAILSFIILFLLVTIISLFIPSSIRVSKAIDFQHDKQAVKQLLTDTAQWSRWHPVFMKNSRYFSARSADYKLTRSTDSLVEIEVGFEKQKLVYGWQFHHYPENQRYTLQWFTDFKPGWYPWEKLGSLFYEKTYGIMMEQGLRNIDSVLNSSDSIPQEDLPVD